MEKILGMERILEVIIGLCGLVMFGMGVYNGIVLEKYEKGTFFMVLGYVIYFLTVS